jgi:medium-chain acyl-[acyl-carrier-protein] hydrolase
MVDTYKASFPVYSYQVDSNQDAKISALFGFFIEAAGFHADRLAVSHNHLKNTIGAFWALSKFNIQILAFPKWMDEVTVETWPSGYNRLVAHRHFLFKNTQGQILAQGTSDWIIMDTITRQIVNPQEIIPHLPIDNQGTPLEVKTIKIQAVNETIADKTTRRALISDIDMNKHVNSLKYVEWSLDCINIDYLENHRIIGLDVNFQHEITYGQEVDIYWQNLSEGLFQFKGVLKPENKPAFSVQLKFE